MLAITPAALREGCDRASDLFLLGRLRGFAAVDTFSAVFASLGLDDAMRADLERAAAGLVPIEGDAVLEAGMAAAMVSGALLGLLIADSALPAEQLDLPVRGETGS